VAFKSIAPVASSQRTQPVSRRWQSRRQGDWAPQSFPEPEPKSKAGTNHAGDVEFSTLDAEIGAILAEVNPAVYAFVAARVAQLK
jgi:hypothetical protein